MLRGDVAGRSSHDQCALHWTHVAETVHKPAHTMPGDMLQLLQQQFSLCDIPVFAKKLYCGDRIMTYGIANGAFLLILAIL